MCIGFAFSIAKTPAGNLPSRTHPAVSVLAHTPDCIRTNRGHEKTG